MLTATIVLCAVVLIVITVYMWKKGTPPQKKLARKGHKDNDHKT